MILGGQLEQRAIRLLIDVVPLLAFALLDAVKEDLDHGLEMLRLNLQVLVFLRSAVSIRRGGARTVQGAL